MPKERWQRQAPKRCRGHDHFTKKGGLDLDSNEASKDLKEVLYLERQPRAERRRLEWRTAAVDSVSNSEDLGWVRSTGTALEVELEYWQYNCPWA